MPTVACPDCSGLTFQVQRCRCTDGGDRLLVEGDAYADEPYRECRLCRGDGSVAVPCPRCERTGRRRAEVVVSVVNLDTGAVASERFRPGRFTPVRSPDGLWEVPLRRVAARLAARVGARDVGGISPTGPALDAPLLWLPRTWRPDLPADQRYAAEAEALARADHTPWVVLLGRAAEPPPPPAPGRHLGWLCGVAGLLHLDLVVEARRRHDQVCWDVRFELPGGDVPDAPRRQGFDLPAAVVDTTVAAALAGLAESGLTAPAYTVRSSLGVPAAPADVDVAALGGRILTDLAGGPGAQAIWRDGRWWHTLLRPGGRVEVLHEHDTGQIVRWTTTALLRVTEPPDPAWWGAPITHRDCPDCRPGSRLRRCACRVGAAGPDPDCPDCAGAGMAPGWGPCPACGGSRRVYSAVTLTVTDLTRVTHRLWQPVAGEPATRIGAQPNGAPVVQLREHYRAARLAAPFGVRPEHLIRLDQPGGLCLGQDLLEGTVTLDRPDDDLAARYVAAAARGAPGARLVVLAQPPDVPPVADLVRLAAGLDLAVAVTACDHRRDTADPTRLHGVRWQLDIVPRDAPLGLAQPWWPSPETAVADCLDRLGGALLEAVPRNPDRPVPAPTATAPGAVGDPASLLRRLARRYAGQVVAVRVDRAGCQFWLAEEAGARALTGAVTLVEAVAALRLD
ncbi:hypothetical protein ABGB16_21795 [Micromonospora sp. B11E3]|uniref:hypothetical protein n=1 Tax=Micromonospora sp. B11E3 TaxID=3153562 RepID=UPI00325F0282